MANTRLAYNWWVLDLRNSLSKYYPRASFDTEEFVFVVGSSRKRNTMNCWSKCVFCSYTCFSLTGVLFIHDSVVHRPQPVPSPNASTSSAPSPQFSEPRQTSCHLLLDHRLCAPRPVHPNPSGSCPIPCSRHHPQHPQS